MKTLVALGTAALMAFGQAGAGSNPNKALRMEFIDVEGGQATLIISPSNESLLVDTGWPGFNSRDADRIVAAAKQSGVSRIDYLVITHFHTDHVGGVPQLAAKIPIGTFVDHGDTVEKGDANGDAQFKAYLAAREKGKHLLVKPGDTIPIKGLDVRVVSAAGEVLKTPLPVGGQPNAACASAPLRDVDPSENARSVGLVVAYGAFRFLDLGDLTWNKEKELVCPNNQIGPIDLYLTTHHGLNQSNNPVLVNAIHPRVAIMNNGAKKGGSPEAWQTIHDVPGLELWQVHYAEGGGADHNVNEQFIANKDESTSHSIRMFANRDGSFVVTNLRNDFQKRYPPHDTK